MSSTTAKPPQTPSHDSAPPTPTCEHRRVIPGATWHITKKTNDDHFWLVPCALINAILLYLLLLKARRYGILLHSYQFLSNHFHLVLTDPMGTYPAFMREFCSESGKAIKIARGTSCHIWSKQKYSAVRLLDLDAAERACAYGALNPAESGLTTPEEWPGVTSARSRFGDTIQAIRPEIYFSKKRPVSVAGTLAPLSCAFPLSLEMKCSTPIVDVAVVKSETTTSVEPGDEVVRTEGSPAAPRAPERRPVTTPQDLASESRIRRIIDVRVARIRRALDASGRSFLGADRVMRVPPTTRSTHPLRRLSPRFSTRNRDLLERAIADWKQFEIDHEAAKRRYIAGEHRTLFPLGTYGYRVVLGVRVAGGKGAAA